MSAYLNMKKTFDIPEESILKFKICPLIKVIYSFQFYKDLFVHKLFVIDIGFSIMY